MTATAKLVVARSATATFPRMRIVKILPLNLRRASERYRQDHKKLQSLPYLQPRPFHRQTSRSPAPTSVERCPDHQSQRQERSCKGQVRYVRQGQSLPQRFLFAVLTSQRCRRVRLPLKQKQKKYYYYKK